MDPFSAIRPKYYWLPGIITGEIGVGLLNALAEIYVSKEGFRPLYFLHGTKHVRLRRENVALDAHLALLVPKLDIKKKYVTHVDKSHCKLVYLSAGAEFKEVLSRCNSVLK